MDTRFFTASKEYLDVLLASITYARYHGGRDSNGEEPADGAPGANPQWSDYRVQWEKAVYVYQWDAMYA